MMTAPTRTMPPRANFTEYIEDIPLLADSLNISTQHHKHLCPRQVLGARIGLAGLQALGAPVNQQKKELLVISETDGCFLSGLEAATNVSVNHRTMRVVDFGKLAATLVHVASEEAVRISLQPGVRKLAWKYAWEKETRHYFAMLTGYQKMPIEELLVFQPVKLTISAKQLISRPGIRTKCTNCGEEVINEREIYIEGKAYCLDCAGRDHYYSQI